MRNRLSNYYAENARIACMARWSSGLILLLMLSPAVAQEQQRGLNGVIHGIATTSTGEPAKGIRLRARPLGTGGGALETKTNNEGGYSFCELTFWGTYRIFAHDEEAGYSSFSTGDSLGNAISEVAITPEHPDAEFNFSLPPKAGFIQIHLTNRRTGAAISKMTAWLTSFEAADLRLFSMSGLSDYVILVPPDRNLLLHVVAEGFREWNESIGRGRPINVPSESKLTLHVQLDPLH
jgi:hypothetical protein